MAHAPPPHKCTVIPTLTHTVVYTKHTCTDMHKHACTCIVMYIHTPIHTQTWTYSHTYRDRHIQTPTYTDRHTYRYTRIISSLKYQHINTFLKNSLEEMCKIINYTVHYAYLYFSRTVHLLTTTLQMILNLFLSNANAILPNILNCVTLTNKWCCLSFACLSLPHKVEKMGSSYLTS